MRTLTVDVAVIGAGTAGLAARREAEKAGASVVMIESGTYSTTCARVGCMPSKLLIASADAAYEVARAGQFGIRVPAGVRVDGPAVLARVRAERDRFVNFVRESVEEIPAAQRLRGRARFVGPTSLMVGDDTRVESRAVVIATGSSAMVPPGLEPLRPHLLVSDDIFELPDLPDSLAVIGTGVIIGLEIGQALHRLGVRTTVFARSDRLGSLTDPEVRAVAADVLSAELDLQRDVVPEVERDGDGFSLRWRGGGGEPQERRVAAVLCATGRWPNVDGLDLVHAGIDGVPIVDPRTMQCGDRPIFLAGDAANYRPLLHEAADEGIIAGRNAASWPALCAHVRRTPLSIVFTHPAMAIAGQSFAELAGTAIEIGTVSYADQGRARVMGENAGLVRIYAHRQSGELLGAELFGPRVEHTAHLLAWAVQRRVRVDEALAMPFYHPVLEEGLRTALRDLGARLGMRAPERPHDLECGPGV